LFTDAFAINDHGQLGGACYFLDVGRFRGFIATPANGGDD
jgi:hypothetical protein